MFERPADFSAQSLSVEAVIVGEWCHQHGQNSLNQLHLCSSVSRGALTSDGLSQSVHDILEVSLRPHPHLSKCNPALPAEPPSGRAVPSIGGGYTTPSVRSSSSSRASMPIRASMSAVCWPSAGGGISGA